MKKITKPTFKIRGYRPSKPSQKPFEQAYLPPLPEHLKKHTEPKLAPCGRLSDAIDIATRLLPEWNAHRITDEEKQYQFLNAINDIVLCIRRTRSRRPKKRGIREDALNFLMTAMIERINKTARDFCIWKNLDSDPGDIALEWEQTAYEMTKTLILGDTVKGLEAFYTQYPVEIVKKQSRKMEYVRQKHRHLVNRELKNFIKVLFNTIRMIEYVDETSDAERKGMTTDPKMLDIIKILACRETAEDSFQNFTNEFREKHKLTGGAGYDPLFLKPNEKDLLDNYKQIQAWYDSFNNGELEGIKTKTELDNYIEEHDLKDRNGNKMTIQKVIEGIQDIPHKTSNLFEYLFIKEKTASLGLFGRLNRLYKALDNYNIPIQKADDIYDNYIYGTYPDDEAFKKLPSNEELKEEINQQIAAIERVEMKEALIEMAQNLSPRQIDYLALMLRYHSDVSEVANSLGVSRRTAYRHLNQLKKLFKGHPAREILFE
ncbi:MAG: ECF-type sigma factor [Desulfatiglandales bacterium]